MIYVSIDLETTGLDPNNCQILEIGAVAQELGGNEIERFHSILKHDEVYGSTFALNMNQRLLKAISEGEGKEPREALDEFVKWVKKFKNSTNNVVVAGKNFAGFDKPFLMAVDGRFRSMFHRRVLDPAILYIKFDDEVAPDLATCLERAGLPNEVTHNAVEDAAQVRDLIEHHFAKCRESVND